MLISTTGLNPLLHSAPAISNPTACLAAVWLREMGTNAFVCVRKRVTLKKEDERKNAEVGRGAIMARGRNVVAVCQLLIRALVCPLWVRVRDGNRHTPLSVDISFADWN